MKILLALLLFLTSIANSQWQQVNNGLPTTPSASLALGPNEAGGTCLYVASYRVALSTDNGTSWTNVNSNLPDYPQRAIAVNGSSVFVATGVGIYLSTNSGASWALANGGLGSVYNFAVNGSLVFAGTNNSGVFLSTDNGSSWAAVNSGLTHTTVLCLLVAPNGAGGTNLFAGTSGGGVFLSTNNGTNWTAVNTGLTSLYIRSLNVSGTSIFAGTDGSGIFRSTDNGATWVEVNTGLPASARVFALSSSGGKVFAGVYPDGVFLSTDNGANWSDFNTGLGTGSIKSLVNCGTYLYMGAQDYSGVWRRPLADALPVQLSMFVANAIPSDHVRLQWTTVSEASNYGFEMQKSATSQLQYETIPNSFVAGHGTTNAPQHYSWIDSAVTAGVCYYRLKQIDLDGTVHYSDGIRVIMLSGVKEEDVPTDYLLSQNYPNPWNPSTTIRYGLPHTSFVKLTVYNTLGQQVSQLVNEQQVAGYHDVVFNGNGRASGIYFYRLQAGDYVATKKLILLR